MDDYIVDGLLDLTFISDESEPLMDIPIQVTSDESGPLLEIPVQIIDDPTMAAAEIHLNEVLMLEIERAQNTETNIANNLAAEILRSTGLDTEHTNAINVLNGDETTPGSVKKTVADEIAKVIAGAPESFDTLKELADWISYNETDAAGMNSRIIANKNAIDNEVVAARAAEDSLSTRITNEVSRATAAEQALGNLLQSYVDTIPEITIVANNIENVNDVAEGISTINTLASDLTNVDTVAGSISNVNATGSDIANVNTVASDLTNVDILATSIANVDTVAASISDVNAVSSDIANVNSVVSDLTNIDAVAGSIANVNTVSASIASVNAVATNISGITLVSNDLTNIDAVAGAISTINTVAGDLTNVDILASSISDINSVSDSISDITTVSASIADVSAVANNLSDIRAAVQSAEDAEAWAVGTIGGVPVASSAEQHENNSKYYAELAESIASDINSIEVTTMPTASAELVNQVRIYIGQTTSTYTSGQSYQCIEDPENAGVYIWEPTASKVTVDNVTIQENASGQLETVVKIWDGSSADWKALSSEEKSKWTIVNITDDADDTSTIETQIQALTNSVNTNTGNIQTLTNTVNTNSDNIADDNDEYNSNHNYVVGEYCISPDDGTLQKCVVATSGGSWATVKDTCFTKDSLTNVVKTLNSKLSDLCVGVYVHKYFNSSKDFVYTGISYVAPDDGYYCLTFQAFFNQAKPDIVAVSRKESRYDEISSAVVGRNMATCPVIMHLYKGNSLFVWAKYSLAVENSIIIYGFYIKA